MDVAVPDMAEGDRPDAGEPLGYLIGGADDEVGDPADRHRDIVLDRARVKLRLDDRLANPPQLLGLRPALRDHAVGDEILDKGRFQKPLQQPAHTAIRLARRHFEQHVPGMGFAERVDRAWYVRKRQVEAGARDELECGQLIGGCGAGVREQRHYVFDPGEAEKGDLDFARFRKEFQGRRGNDPERALTAMKSCFRS
jgi:hypothetical protein